MTPSIIPIVAFVAVAVLAGLTLWSRRRRSAGDPLASLREEILPAARREPDVEVRISPVAESHNELALDRGSEASTEGEKAILPPSALTAREKGAAAPELLASVMTAVVLEIEAPPQDAGVPPEVPAMVAAETDRHFIESPVGASVAGARAIEEAVSVETTGGLPETEPPIAPPDSMPAPAAAAVDGDLSADHPPTASGVEAQLLPATGDGLEMAAQPEVRLAHGGEEQTIEPSVSIAAEAIAVIAEETCADTELPPELPDVGMEQSAVPVPDQIPGPEGGQADLHDREPTADPHDQSGIFSQESEFTAAIEGLNDSPDAVETVVDEVEAPPPVSGDAASPAADAGTTPPAPPQRRPRAYRDRRGSRRAGLSGARPSLAPARAGAGTAPAEAFLRLSLHPIQRTVSLSLVLGRPEGFPEQITLAIEGHPSVRAYDDGRRYDDTQVPVGATLLGGELRLTSLERFQWLRSARRVQVFSTAPSEPDLISVSAARAGAEHAVLCGLADVAEVRRIAELAGSPPLVSHDGWPGVPAGYAVLSAYCPICAITAGIDPSLRTLDPGASITIELSGGLAIRARVFAERHPPLISIDGLPERTAVSIGGENAQQSESGAWVAPGWDAPGRHVIDVVPGPSLTYEIAPDPAFGAGWPFWDAHAGRFGSPAALPWERAEICGAQVAGPSGSVIIAADTHTTTVALGTHATAAQLRHRTDAPVSVGAIRGGAAFLLSAWGGRRNHGRVVWLGNPIAARSQASSRPDRFWVETVRNAASRRLPLEGADEVGRKAWEEAVARARKLARAGW